MIGFCIYTENLEGMDSHGFGHCHINLRPVMAHKLTEVPHGGQVCGFEIGLKNPSDTDTDRLIRALENLEVSCQGNNDDKPHGVYAWEVKYRDVYSVELAEAERMVWLLKRIDKRLERFGETEGPSLTFGQFAGRIARACEAEFFCLKTDDATVGYDESEYRLMPLGEGVGTIDHLISKWQSAPEAVCA